MRNVHRRTGSDINAIVRKVSKGDHFLSPLHHSMYRSSQHNYRTTVRYAQLHTVWSGMICAFSTALVEALSYCRVPAMDVACTCKQSSMGRLATSPLRNMLPGYSTSTSTDYCVSDARSWAMAAWCLLLKTSAVNMQQVSKAPVPVCQTTARPRANTHIACGTLQPAMKSAHTCLLTKCCCRWYPPSLKTTRCHSMLHA